MAISLADALGIVLSVVRQMTGREDVDVSASPRDLGIRSAERHILRRCIESDAIRRRPCSKRIHGYPRLGDSGVNLVTPDEVDTIDVSAVDTNLIGHFYYGENRSVLSDLFNLIKGHPVPRFGLPEKKRGARSYWVFQP